VSLRNLPLFRRLGDERGFALVLALGATIVLSATVVGVISYTSTNSRSSSYSASKQSAYALAEAGINNALSVIGTSLADTTKIKPQPQYAGDPNSTILTLQDGTATWGGSYDSSTMTWTIKSIGSIRNPTGPTAPNITRTLQASAQIDPPPYSFASLNSNCDQHSLVVRSSGTLTVNNTLYVNSCNSPSDAFDVFGPGGNISAPDIRVVGGWETHNGDTVTVGGVTCSLSKSVAPLTATQPAGCPKTGQTAIGDPFAGKLTAPTLGAAACSYPVYGSAVSYSPTKQKLVAGITATQTAITSDGTAVANGDVVQVESEKMLVTAGGGTTTLTVQRAYNGTTAATHGSGKEIKRVPVTGTAGTPALPAPCEPTGTVTLQPGTYYGGICVGAASGNDCGSNIGGTCTTTGTTANVTLAPGTYIMAGGGFFVCGSSTLSAPNVLIYNTQDPSNTAGSGAIDQVELNTTGSVTLGPQTSGVYPGLTIFQDPNLGVAGSVTCDSKSSFSSTPSQTQINEWDIALMSMASTGSNGALGSISGTIYAPAYRSMFGVSVSGTANLAVLTSCLVIDGGTSTFNFQTSGLFGTKFHLTSQWG
jgi:hypothetical protein